MDDILDFLTDNPVIGILLVFWLFNLLFGKKKKKQGQVTKDGTAQGTKADASGKDAPRKTAFSEALNKLEQALQEAEQKSENTRTVNAVQLSPAPVAARVESRDDPFAFHSLMNPNRSGENSNYDATAKDYDVTGEDYDITSKDYDQTAVDYDTRSAAFEFHSATKLTAEKEYHLKFRGFRSAQRLSNQERGDESAFESRGIAPDIIAQMLSSRDDIRRAFIMQEILGKPKSLRLRD